MVRRSTGTGCFSGHEGSESLSAVASAKADSRPLAPTTDIEITAAFHTAMRPFACLARVSTPDSLRHTEHCSDVYLSSLRMVPAPGPSAIVAPLAFERFTRNTSSGSRLRSPLTVTLTAQLVRPAGIVSVPEAAL